MTVSDKLSEVRVSAFARADPATADNLGEWMQRALRVLSGDTSEPELQARASLVSSDNPGVVPPMLVGDVRDMIDTARPFLDSTRRLKIPSTGMQLTIPTVAVRPTAGEQVGEKDTLTHTATEIVPATYDPVSIGGYGDMSLQLLKRSDPSYLASYLGLLADAYGLDCDSAAISALLDAGPVDGGTLDPEAARFGEAWARGGQGERFLWLSTSAVMAFVDAKATDGTPLYPGISAPISSLTPVYTPVLDGEAVDVIVGPSRGFGWAEDGTYTLEVDVPARAGRDVGLVGMLWYAPLAGLFTTYTLES